MRAYIDITSNETYKSKLIPSKIMEASLCLPTKSHHHFAFNFPKSKTIPHCHHQLSHNLSLLFSTRLHGGPRQRLTTLVLRAHITPPEDSSLNKARKHAVRSAATAAMVIACTLGAMCTSSKASAISDWMKFGPPDPPINTVQNESIKALQGALRCDIGSQKQVQSLRDSLLEILAIGLDEKARKDVRSSSFVTRLIQKSLYLVVISEYFSIWKTMNHDQIGRPTFSKSLSLFSKPTTRALVRSLTIRRKHCNIHTSSKPQLPSMTLQLLIKLFGCWKKGRQLVHRICIHEFNSQRARGAAGIHMGGNKSEKKRLFLSFFF